MVVGSGVRGEAGTLTGRVGVVAGAGSAGLDSNLVPSPVSSLSDKVDSKLTGGSTEVEVGSAEEVPGEDSRSRSPLVAGF